ncbi:hypothetical protein BFI45_12470 [Yersinia pestis subsp. microtus bv. Altaica]|uniref:hypothetical protein n=1 Tax=Yersinia pestis TaxID=632 RepID=UPI00030B1AAA|nr:hypothetical protein [Yersinia pestis]AJK14420.1 hypothetical protein CH60_3224 [Yersinia pestis str. Pestoides B]KPD58502.1 hypothetical protein AC596_01765 [Yersinia pestis subsp. microtus bv. Hissarica]KPD59805.1 hypothetical protein AC595_04300 [Yersinia pestis subsp. microtus bv. Xilingolensis]KPD61352.1 hypothetical protein AC597_03160 [Yersinia pestis subsp. microtus bv. Talassica]KPD71385.1 hypothetical protein AC599_00200 [Yersinia pestis subsp. microtus bv. Altaica]
MYDNTPREVEEVIDHCRALIYAIITLESPEVKEILNFVLQQQIDLLSHQRASRGRIISKYKKAS